MSEGVVDNENMRVLRHDIKNQLSNITLLVAELRYEISAPSDECLSYLDMIQKSVSTIDGILKGTQQKQ